MIVLNLIVMNIIIAVLNSRYGILTQEFSREKYEQWLTKCLSDFIFNRNMIRGGRCRAFLLYILESSSAAAQNASPADSQNGSQNISLSAVEKLQVGLMIAAEAFISRKNTCVHAHSRAPLLQHMLTFCKALAQLELTLSMASSIELGGGLGRGLVQVRRCARSRNALTPIQLSCDAFEQLLFLRRDHIEHIRLAAHDKQKEAAAIPCNQRPRARRVLAALQQPQLPHAVPRESSPGIALLRCHIPHVRCSFHLMIGAGGQCKIGGKREQFRLQQGVRHHRDQARRGILCAASFALHPALAGAHLRLFVCVRTCDSIARCRSISALLTRQRVTAACQTLRIRASEAMTAT